MDEATLQIVLQWKEENERALTEVKAKLAELTGETQGTNVAMDALNAARSPQGWAQFAVVLGIVATAAEPLAAVILSSAVALISFTAGAAAFIAIAALVAGGFGLIAAGVMALGIDAMGGLGGQAAFDKAKAQLFTAQQNLKDFNSQHTGALSVGQQNQQEDLLLKLAAAQEKYNAALAASQSPITNFTGAVMKMVDALGIQAAPMAAMILFWAEKAIPTIESFGRTILTWFGERLPGVLRGISGVLRDLMPDFEQFGQFLGHIADHVGPQIAPIAEAFAHLAFGAVEGLITNVVRLSDWFQKELPKLGPIVSQIFGAFGSAIQGVASHWAKLTDWVIVNWPATVKEAQAWLAKIQTDLHNFNINDLGDAIQGFISLGRGIQSISGAITSILGALSSLNAFLKPIADTLNAIQAAFSANGAWLGGVLRGSHILPSAGGLGGSTPQGTIPGGGRTGGLGRQAITINVNGAQSPAATGRAVALHLRRLTAV